MEEGGGRQAYLEGEQFVEALEAACSAVEEVVADAEVDGEVGHDELSACRDAGRHLTVPAGLGDVVAEVGLGGLSFGSGWWRVVDYEVGAAVVVGIERCAHVEHVAEVVHGTDVEASHAVGVGQYECAEVGLGAPALPASEEHQVGGPVALHGGHGACGRLLAGSPDVVGCRQAYGGHVEPGIGQRGVAVAEVRCRQSEVDIPLWRQSPAQVDVGVHIGRQLRADDAVVGPFASCIRLPSVGQSEVPLVVEGQAWREGGDGGPLEEVCRQGVAYLRVEVVVGQSGPLVDTSVDACRLGARWWHEGVLGLQGDVAVHGAHLGVVALEEGVGVEHGTVHHLGFEAVDDACGVGIARQAPQNGESQAGSQQDSPTLHQGPCQSGP